MTLSNDLLPLNIFQEVFQFSIDLAYAQAAHDGNGFGRIYHPSADTLWVHRRLAAPVLTAAVLARRLGWTLEFKDGLRPIEAQQLMADAGHDARLVSRPGEGPHPRGMAIDVVARDEDGALVEMGTPFDSFVDTVALASGRNPAARDYTGGWSGDEATDTQIFLNRKKLEYLFLRAASLHGETIVPLPEEWWDFRLPREVWQQLPPASEADLTVIQHLTTSQTVGWERIRTELSEPVRSRIEGIKTSVRRITQKLRFTPGTD